MKKYAVFILIFCCRPQFIFTQQLQDPSVKYANAILSDDIRQYLSTLASDAFEGRETGTKGQVLAGQYISDQFKEDGIPPRTNYAGYFETYPLIEYKWGSPAISDKKQSYVFLKDYYGYQTSNNDLTLTANDIIFLGYGIDDSIYSDYKNTDVTGKVIIVEGGEPMFNGRSLLTGTDSLTEWSTDWRKKVSAATKHGVKLIMVIDTSITTKMNNPQWTGFLQSTLMKLQSEYTRPPYCNNLFISQDMANALTGSKHDIKNAVSKINKHGVPGNFSVTTALNIDLQKQEIPVDAQNVLGFIEGTDLKDEVVVVSAHYDHLGEKNGAIYNGADDDASGTAALMEMAKVVMQAKKDGNGPRRSILFIAFSGEEKGLLGSKYYADNPEFPVQNTVADLNMDMIGRIDEVHRYDSDYIYIIGDNFLSTALHAISEAADKNYSTLKLDYRYNSTDDPNRFYYRGDQFNFAQLNIPVIFYFSGIHADYHQPTDDIDKIDFPLLTERTQLVFHTLWILANEDNRIKVDISGN